MTDENTNEMEDMNMQNDGVATEADIDNLSGEQAILAFIEQLILDKGEEPTDELRKELLNKFNTKLNEKLIAAMPSELVSKLSDNLENLSEDDIIKEIDDSDIPTEEITKTLAEEFRDEYLSDNKRQ